MNTNYKRSKNVHTHITHALLDVYVCVHRCAPGEQYDVGSLIHRSPVHRNDDVRAAPALSRPPAVVAVRKQRGDSVCVSERACSSDGQPQQQQQQHKSSHKHGNNINKCGGLSGGDDGRSWSISGRRLDLMLSSPVNSTGVQIVIDRIMADDDDNFDEDDEIIVVVDNGNCAVTSA